MRVKPRIYSPMELFPQHIKDALIGWLTTGGRHGLGHTYKEAAEKLRLEFGIKMGTSALCNFYTRHFRPKPAPIEVTLGSGPQTFTLVINLRIQPEQ